MPQKKNRKAADYLELDLVSATTRPRRRWPKRSLWLGTVTIVLGYIVRLVWLAVGGTIQIHLNYTPTDRTSSAPLTHESRSTELDELLNSETVSLEEKIDLLQAEVSVHSEALQNALSPLLLAADQRDELTWHFKTLSASEFLNWLPEWLQLTGTVIPDEIELRLTISRYRLAQLEELLATWRELNPRLVQ